MLKVHEVKLLLIDDSVDFQLLVKRFLEGSGLTCCTAADTFRPLQSPYANSRTSFCWILACPEAEACSCWIDYGLTCTHERFQ